MSNTQIIRSTLLVALESLNANTRREHLESMLRAQFEASLAHSDLLGDQSSDRNRMARACLAVCDYVQALLSRENEKSEDALIRSYSRLHLTQSRRNAIAAVAQI